jgi:3-oxoadipate enol-lactonase
MSAAVNCAFSVDGSGPPLFLVHGVGGSHHSWDGLVAQLRSSFRCISYDLRGHGRSPAPPPPYSMDDLVEDLEALRRELRIEQAHFAGHSLGGMVVPAYAHRYPQHVVSLGLFSTAAFRRPEDRARVIGIVERMRRDGVAAALGALKERWFTPEFAASHPDVVARRIEQVRAMKQELYLTTFEIYAHTEMSAWLPQIRQPCLVMTGENDLTCTPRLNQQIATALPDAELVVLPKLRHSILTEAPEQVAERVVWFLRRQTSEGSSS